MAYILDGNLYFQDGSQPPRQLTHSGEEWRIFFFSEDGEQIFFLRGRWEQSVYSIRVDGGQEQALVTGAMLRQFGAAYDASTTPCEPVLVPHTPLLLFRSCSHPDDMNTVPEDDLFSVDTASHQIKRLFSRGQAGDYYVSPDGTMLAIERESYIDIVGMNGKMIRHRLATYPTGSAVMLRSLTYWLADSSGLILTLPVSAVNDSTPPLYEVWRYSLDTGKRARIDLDPPIMSYEITRVSPDGNWVTYCNSEKGCFLGSLRDGSTQELPGLMDEWNPDSVHFVYGVPQPGGSDLYLASVNASPVLIGQQSSFTCWLDGDRYIYLASTQRVSALTIHAPAYMLGEIGKEPVPVLTGNAGTMFSYADIVFRYRPSGE